MVCVVTLPSLPESGRAGECHSGTGEGQGRCLTLQVINTTNLVFDFPIDRGLGGLISTAPRVLRLPKGNDWHLRLGTRDCHPAVLPYDHFTLVQLVDLFERLVIVAA